MNKKFLALMMIVAILSAMGVYAVDKAASMKGADTSAQNDRSAFTETTAGTDAADGGTVTELNLSTTASTEKWQGYVGQVSATLKLGTGADVLYNFGASANDQIKSVIASTDTSFNFASLALATGANVDTTFGWTGADADSGASTFDDTTATIAQVTSVPVVNLNAYTGAGVADATIFQGGVFKDDGSVIEGTFDTMAYGVSVTIDQRDYVNTTVVDYQMVVPVNSSGLGLTTTYYFFLDIE